ncbi:hypothetical protein CPB83DRAFT_260593 [Crepidotus variabilis]|uniref:Calpain catalytic domain-containing protein n=1 Tax=Crepidotus variabilis TaxID=179855 RepID=A0A9P6EIB1_9AGAR|nr:hypothetical protein CPB83DRAFT_260593 [Crepidotus variabilis]
MAHRLDGRKQQAVEEFPLFLIIWLFLARYSFDMQLRQNEIPQGLTKKSTPHDNNEESKESQEDDSSTNEIAEDLLEGENEEDDGDDDYVDTRPSRGLSEDQVSVCLSDEQKEVIQICKAKVKSIAKACRAGNRKFRDIEFDIHTDKHRTYYGLWPVDPAESNALPDVRRVTDIFDQPKFFADVPGSNDVVQGALGDCWFLAAIAATSTVPGLIERCCVARDEVIGVYGFIFQRNGRWVSVIIDDQLFWDLPKFEELSIAEQVLYHDDKDLYNIITRKSGKGLHLSGSGQTGETWVPLIEKAFAKLHGDFKSLEGGWMGEAIEDLTGGATTTFQTSDILDIDRFWEEELCLVNTRQRLFAVMFRLETNQPGATASGLVPLHAYSVLRVQECRGKRFLVVRNPWGKFEWNGPWSDGSKEWTGEWIGVLKELGHNLGDDGTFVMEYKDFLSHWQTIQSTTLFDSSWILSSHWVHIPPHPQLHPWTFGDVIFNFTLPKPCKAYLVLSQLDTRYFDHVEGSAVWTLEFAVYKRGDLECKGVSYSGQFFDRSVTCALDLDEGEYLVFPRVDKFEYKPSGFIKQHIKYFDKRKLGRAFSERATARAIASIEAPSSTTDTLRSY